MEQIIITKPDGSTYPLASKRTATEIKSAKQSWALMDNDVVSISIESPFPQTYGIGDHFTVFGRAYKLNRLPKVKKTGMHIFSYDLEFEGIQYDLIRATYDLTIDTTNNQLQDVQADTLTGNLRRFATVLISNANRVFQDTWVLGSCPETIEDKTLTFGESDNCLSVLQTLCTEFGVEFEIVQSNGKFTINFVSKVGQIFPFTFEFGRGKGLYSLDRQNVDSSNIVTRLKVYGSTSNITNKYRASRLCLPGKNKAQSYIERPEAVAKYGIYESTKYFDDIKPTFNGSITGLVSSSVLKMIDTKMFDLNALEADGKTTKYLISGCAAKIHFNTGNLAGYEFDVHAYNHATNTFTLVKQTDDRGDEFPSSKSPAFQFAQGDEYKLLDVALPEIPYQSDAENKLDEQGNIYYDQNSQPKVQYGLSVTKAYLKTLVGNGTTVNIFTPGDYIPVKDSDIDVDKSVRIKSLTRNLLDEYEYTLTISDTVTTNITNRVISELVDIDKIITINNLKDPVRARANWRSSREVLNMVFDPEGDYYTDKIKPNSIDTLALSVGAKSMQFGLTDTVLQPNFSGDKNIIKVKGGVLTHYTIDEKSARQWVLADNETTFDKDTQAYYIYAKCSTEGIDGSIIFSTDEIKVEQDKMFYHFWIGVVNSVDAELKARSVALSYGFTMINGRFIKTGRIESANGLTYFDLDNSEIGGRITFKSGSSGLTNLDEWGDAAQDIQDAQAVAAEAKRLAQEEEQARIGAINAVNASLGSLQNQVDGVVENWYYEPEPTNGNYPANTWNSLADKQNHVGDTYTSIAQSPAEQAGKSWRWVEDPADTFGWKPISDSDAVKALQEAARAKATADGKSATFLVQPSKYSVGDMWVLSTDWNGFKQGEFLTANIGRDNFIASDWGKKVRYTDDTAADEAKEMLNKLPFVGRNLLRNTRDYAELKHWEEYRWELQAVDDHIGVVNNDWTGHEPAIQLFAKNITDGALSCFQYFDTTPGKSHILSGYIAGHRSAKRILVRHQGGEVAANVVYDSMISGGERLDDWVRINIPFVATKSQAYVVLEMNAIDIAECYIWFKRLKVEIGERATEWSPAYEDTEEGIALAKNEAIEARDKATLAQSAITDMNDDLVFDVSEKQTTRTMWERISGISNTSDNHGTNGSYYKALTEVGKVSSLVSLRNALNAAYNVLSANLGTNELYSNTNKVGFNRQAMALAFANYGNAEVACYNAIQEYYTGIAQSTANASTIPTVVVETSTDQVLRGDGFVPAILSAKRVLKVGDRREVLDKVNLVQNGTSISSLSHWFLNTDQPSKFALNNTDGYVKLNINQNGFGWCFLCNDTKIDWKKGHKYRIKVRFETQNWSFGGVHVAVADGESAFYLFESEAVFPAGNTYYEWSFAVDKDVPTDRDILLRFDMRNMSTTGVLYPFYTFQLYSAIVEEVETIEFGGRNLLQNTLFDGVIPNSIICPKWVFWGGTKAYSVQTQYLPRIIILECSANSGGLYQRIPMYPNTNYLISFYSNKWGEGIEAFPGFEFETSNGRVNIEIPYNWNSVELQSFVITTPSDFYQSLFRINCFTNTLNNALMIGGFKLELGDKATPWQPAPEDAILTLNGAEYVPNTAIASDSKNSFKFDLSWNNKDQSKVVNVVSGKEVADKAFALDYLGNSIKKGNTILEGGLVLSNLMVVQSVEAGSDATGEHIRAGMSGLTDDGLAFFADKSNAYKKAMDYLRGVSPEKPQFLVDDQGAGVWGLMDVNSDRVVISDQYKNQVILCNDIKKIIDEPKTLYLGDTYYDGYSDYYQSIDESDGYSEQRIVELFRNESYSPIACKLDQVEAFAYLYIGLFYQDVDQGPSGSVPYYSTAYVDLKIRTKVYNNDKLILQTDWLVAGGDYMGVEDDPTDNKLYFSGRETKDLNIKKGTVTVISEGYYHINIEGHTVIDGNGSTCYIPAEFTMSYGVSGADFDMYNNRIILSSDGIYADLTNNPANVQRGMLYKDNNGFVKIK